MEDKLEARRQRSVATCRICSSPTLTLLVIRYTDNDLPSYMQVPHFRNARRLGRGEAASGVLLRRDESLPLWAKVAFADRDMTRSWLDRWTISEWSAVESLAVWSAKRVCLTKLEDRLQRHIRNECALSSSNPADSNEISIPVYPGSACGQSAGAEFARRLGVGHRLHHHDRILRTISRDDRTA
nr:hypothetical protein CFP56_22170 [Quercus suber]